MSTEVCRGCLKRGTGFVSLRTRAGGPNGLPYGRLLRLVAGLPAAAPPAVLCDACARLLRRVQQLRVQARRAHRLLCGKVRAEPVPEPTSPTPQPTAPSLTCDICGISTRNKSAMITHQRKHTGERPYKCPYCDQCFTQGGTLTEHIKRRHGDARDASKAFTCEVCGKLFMRRNGLNTHMRIHTAEKPYQCSYCPRSFSQNGTLTQHMMVHTGERPFSCHICHKSFIASTTLKRHLTVHSDEKKFKCDLCDKALKSKFALKKHTIYVHMSEKPVSCEECGARFSTKSNLNSHVKNIHSSLSGECVVCRKHFSNLADHSRIHTGERPFECHICQKCFTQQRGLTAHINKHLNPEKYKCNFEGCDSTFSMSHKLKYHLTKCHGGSAQFPCLLCSRGFYRKSDLTKHLRTCVAKVTKFS